MQSRMDKYYVNQNNDGLKNNEDELSKTTTLSRLDRNQILYKEVSNKELQEFDLNSNVSVIGEGKNVVDINKIREMLDRKYREVPKDKSIGSGEAEIGKISLDETREYDLKEVLKKAHEEKEVNYERERLENLRSTQFDILRDLNITGENDTEEELEKIRAREKKQKEEEKLKELIDTITSKELLTKDQVEELDPLDLLSDLKGDDENTRVMGALTNDVLLDDVQKEKIDMLDVIKTNEKNELENTTELNNIKKLEKTDTLSFTQSDFDDFNDLKEDMRFTKIVIRFLIVVIVIAFIIGCLFLVNKMLGLGLF